MHQFNFALALKTTNPSINFTRGLLSSFNASGFPVGLVIPVVRRQ